MQYHGSPCHGCALIYFFNTLQDETIDQKNTIVVLDDPISSFDSNFYFNAISYIKSKVEDVGQVFILTHKFSLLQDYKNMFHARDFEKSFDFYPRK